MSEAFVDKFDEQQYLFHLEAAEAKALEKAEKDKVFEAKVVSILKKLEGMSPLAPIVSAEQLKQQLIKDFSMAIPQTIGGSFKLSVPGTVTPRLIVALDGLEKEGKTHFALTAPGPIAYQGLDIGTEGVVEKFIAKKPIYMAEYGFQVEKGDNQDATMKKAAPVFESFIKDYKEVMLPGFKSGKIRSGIWDTGSDIWGLQRLARLGKLSQVMPHHYTALNAEYQNLIREVYETSGNLIILHKLKPEWKDNPTTGKGNKTGQFERDGFGGTGFLVQVNATAWREKPNGDFHITVRDCRQNPLVAGLDLAGEMATFPWLATFVYPGTSLEDWS